MGGGRGQGRGTGRSRCTFYKGGGWGVLLTLFASVQPLFRPPPHTPPAGVKALHVLAFTSQFAIMSHHIEMMLAQEGEEGVAAAATGEDGFGGLQPLHEVGERVRWGGYL